MVLVLSKWSSLLDLDLIFIYLEHLDAGIVNELELVVALPGDSMRLVGLCGDGLDQFLGGLTLHLEHVVHVDLVELVVLDHHEHLQITHIPQFNAFLQEAPPPLTLYIDPLGLVLDLLWRLVLHFLHLFIFYMSPTIINNLIVFVPII